MRKKFVKISSVLLVLSLLNTMELRGQVVNDSLVNVAFKKVAEKDVSGAVSNINISELLKKDYHSGSTDNLQSFIGGYTGNIWGQSPLILVDGVPRDASDVDASAVQSVTVLKDVSAIALYGSKAAKGVVLITTKRGKIAPMKIELRANTGLYFPKSYPKYLDAASYMTLYNEACRNDGITEKYSPDLIYNTASGTNPYRYPNLQFYNSQYLRKAYNKTDVTGEVFGGNKRTQYYTNFSMMYNNTLLKYGEAKNDNTFRFRVRANVDMNLTSWLTASADAAINFEDRYWGRDDFWNMASTLRPNWFSPLVPISMIDTNISSLSDMANTSSHIVDGKYLLGGTSTDLTNNLADMLAAGYVKYRTRNFMFDLSLGADLSSILKGLSFKTKYSVDYENYYSEAFKVAYAVYEPTWSNVNGKDLITGLTKYNDDTSSSSEYLGDSKYSQTMSLSAQFDYNRTFAKDHNISATLLGWGYQTQNSVDANHKGSDYHRVSNVNLGLQASYNYRHKYYFNFSSAVVHSAKLPENHRNAFSPTYTLGWRLSDENWFRNKVHFIDNLKLEASYGNLHQDIDISDYYMYQGYYDVKGGWYQWHDSSAGGNTTASKRGSNPDLTFITREEYRIGLDASLFNHLITLTTNYFLQYTRGGLVQGNNTIYPSYFSSWDFSFLPYINWNNDKRSGVDFSLNIHKKLGEVDCNFGFSGMYYTSKVLRRDEVYQDAYQYRVGKPLDSYWGYICEGFFKDQADIDGHATQTFGSVKPGDLKYKDVNGDGVVDLKDQVNLGHNGWSVSPFTMGLNLTLKWKNFTLFALGTGQTGSIAFKNSSYYWVYGSGKYSEVVMGRWTEATQNAATYPRLTTTNNSNNFQNSTFWMYKNNRFDLQRVQLTYDLPQGIFTKKSVISALSVYISGEGLATISKERKLMEMNVGGAPYCRFFNIGFKAAF